MIRCWALILSLAALAGCRAAPRAASAPPSAAAVPATVHAANTTRLPPIESEVAASDPPAHLAARPADADVRQVSHAEELPDYLLDPDAVTLPIGPPPAPPEADEPAADESTSDAPEEATTSEVLPPPRGPLSLDEVIAAVDRSFPLLDAAQRERTIAEGEQQVAAGEFDTQLKSYNISTPMGFYQTYKSGISLAQPLANGGQVYSGYRLGRGDYPTWDGMETNDAGEFNGGMAFPLLRDRAIDKRRAGVQKADLARQAVEPAIRTQRIDYVRAASYAYWTWVAAGRNLHVADALLDNARERNEGLRLRVERGDLAEIELTDNERLIVSRQAKRIDAQRKFLQAAIKLSLFYRGADGQPVVPAADRLPADFPAPARIDPDQVDADIALALASRPELQELSLLIRQVEVEMNLAENQKLPGLSAGAYAAKDVGAPTPKNDKTPFQMEASLLFDVPLQRRAANGRLRAAAGKRAQLSAKMRFVRDKIATDVQNAATALDAARQQIGQAHESARLAREMEQAERRKFELGDSNLLLVNIREQQTADAAAIENDAYEAYFQAEADYRAALALP